ncbi:helix-turn-helix domain-containing protein, partial [Paenibacillus darwinianus]|uniref:helix-turn-helix domain-containing protein n=1 Tax=Paenibacillus darwinianus TaxID=1380763 RepID=UPI0005688140
QGELHPDVMAITDHILRIPSLRERKEDLHEYIRLLIGIYNSRFGKQVVGVRDEVFHYLLHYEWRENMAELKRIVKELVRTAQGYYIEENQLHLLPEHNEIVANKEPLINLHGTLNEIEKEIIGYVLKEENMNQTKAAERLGINRSTLWRKLNEK